ncbi:serpin-ZX-like protein, partial [Trifolium pratense]
AKEVNLWVGKKTNYLIKELLPPGSVTSQTSLIFANALYFKGAWAQNFDFSKTKDYDFHLLNGSSVKVPFMTSTENHRIEMFDGYKVLRLPYKKGEDKRRFSMYFFLPNAKDGLSALVKKVTSTPPDFRDFGTEVGHCRIPKFDISFGLETTDMLKELGVDLPFSPGGLTKMVDFDHGDEIFVSKIFHKSFIKIEEKGAEAAVVTLAVLNTARCARPRPRPRLDFVADHPFLFLIREDLTETILFIGQVLNPLAR